MSARDALPSVVAVASSSFSQPTIAITASTICLMSGYPHGDVFLDLWGTYSDADGYEVQAFSLTGEKGCVDLTTMPGTGSNEQLRQMEDWLCRNHARRLALAAAELSLERHLSAIE